jgi:glutamate-1-semialdehyde 2,1-aminomutase
MAAIRLARAATGRNKVAKFEGGWHGWSESLFYSIGAAEGDVGQPSTRVESPGLPRAFADNLLTLPYNDSAAFERLRSEAGDVACVIVEAVQGAAGCLVADPHFLQTLRSLCTELDVVFILDEVITGFRLGPSGAAGRLGIEADITALGKALGGGLPIGAVCGRSDFLSLVVPDGDSKPVTLAGTTSGNPLTLAAGGAQINRLLSDNGAAYETLERLGARLRSQLEGVLDEVQVRGAVTGIGSMWGLHLMCDVPPRSIREKSTGAELAMSVLAGYLHLEGVHIMSPVHLGFVSTAHTEDDVDFIAQAHLRALSRMKDEGLLSEVQV